MSAADLAAGRAHVMAAAQAIVEGLEGLAAPAETLKADRERLIDAVLTVLIDRPTPADVVARAADLVDRDWYLAAYPDVVVTGLDPATHFLENPADHRDPGPHFDSRAYASRHGLAPGAHALVHYLGGGAWHENDARAFIALHPDLALAGVTPLEHCAGAIEK